MNEVHRSEIAAGDHLARLLHERVAAVVERHGVHDAGRGRCLKQLACFAGRNGERLVRNHVLLRVECRADHRAVQVVGRRDVDDVDVGVGDEGLVGGICLWYIERVGRRTCGCLAAGRDRHDVDEAETTDGVEVVPAGETGADQAHADAAHQSGRRTSRFRMTNEHHARACLTNA